MSMVIFSLLDLFVASACRSFWYGWCNCFDTCSFQRITLFLLFTMQIQMRCFCRWYFLCSSFEYILVSVSNTDMNCNFSQCSCPLFLHAAFNRTHILRKKKKGKRAGHLWLTMRAHLNFLSNHVSHWMELEHGFISKCLHFQFCHFICRFVERNKAEINSFSRICGFKCFPAEKKH